MPKKTDRSELDFLLKCLSLFPDGATVEQISQVYTAPLQHQTLPPRSLQRRLALLVKEGYITTSGRTQAKKYFLIPTTNALTPDNKTQNIKKDESIQLSSASNEIQKLVSQPIHMRQYVNYNREFLDDYQPNVTRYLPETVCQRLLNLGKTDGDRPAGTFARQIFNRLLIDLSWNSSRLEGNTYSLLETERLLDLSEISQGKDLRETQMIMNHKAAIEFLINSVESIGINNYTILNLHALLSKNLLGSQDACGRLRKIPIGIGESVYLPTGIPHLIDECFHNILEKARLIINPFEQAFFLMVHLPYLQPFEDVNKRVSRLAANIPLILCNLCPLSFIDVPQQAYISGLLGVYELNRVDLLRDVFVWAYERSCLHYATTRRTLGEPDPFRMRYERLIYKAVTRVVLERLDKKMAIALIKEIARELSSVKEQEQFIQTVESELRGLHEGNIACYRLRPSEYEIWKKVW